MESGPKDFMPGFEDYGEFRSALKDAEEAEEISRKQQLPASRGIDDSSEEDSENEENESLDKD